MKTEIVSEKPGPKYCFHFKSFLAKQSEKWPSIMKLYHHFRMTQFLTITLCFLDLHFLNLFPLEYLKMSSFFKVAFSAFKVSNHLIFSKLSLSEKIFHKRPFFINSSWNLQAWKSSKQLWNKKKKKWTVSKQQWLCLWVNYFY